MIEYLYKDGIHCFFLSHCYIKYYSLCSDSEIGTDVYIIYHSFTTNKDECFTYYIDDDIEDLHNILIRRVPYEVSHRF